MKKKILSLFLTLIIVFISLSGNIFAISLEDKEKIYRANEWQLDSAQTVINWLCTDDNFAHHKHTDMYASKFTMLVYGVSNIDVINKLFDNPSEYRKATKEMLLSIINGSEETMLVATKEEVISDVIDALLKGTADYLVSDGVISTASELLLSVKGHDLQQLKYTFVDEQKEEHFNNFVLDNLASDKKDAARESVRKYFKSKKYVEDLSAITEAVSIMQDMLEIAQKSLDIFIEMETYRRNDDNIIHLLKYLQTNASSQHVKHVAGELYTLFYNTYEQNMEMAVAEIKKMVFASASDYILEAIIEASAKILQNEISVYGLFSSAAKLGIDAGEIVSELWFNSSDTKEITASVFILDNIASDLSAYVKICQENFNISYDNKIVNINNASRDAERYINAVKMLLATRKKGEDRYYALKDTIYAADVLSVFHLFGAYDNTLESLEKWYLQRKTEFVTAENSLMYNIETSEYENLYEYLYNREKFVVTDGVLVEYTGSDDSRIATPEGITAIGTHAFKSETLLINVSISGSPIIKSKAFDSCGDLRTIIIPKTVTQIENNAFYNCRKLTIYGYKGSAAETYAKNYGIPFVALYEQEKESWNGTTATKFSGGDGTEKKPYKISSASELAYLAKEVNEGQYRPTYIDDFCYFELTNDIYLNDPELFKVDEEGNFAGDTSNIIEWTPIGNENYSFRGYFNGNGYQIKGLYINTDVKYAGLFGRTNGGKIHNIRLADSYIQSTYDTEEYYDYDALPCVGGIVGYSGSLNSNLINEAYIKATGKNAFLGGVVGYTDSGVELCTNNGTVYGPDCSPAGIVGYAYRSSVVCINSINNGTVRGGGYSSGISNNGTIESCGNFGDVMAEWQETEFYDYGIASGIVKDGNATNCYNYGNVSSCGIARGIGGSATKCYNVGDIKAQQEAFGITDNFRCNQCYNEGTVTAPRASGIGALIVSDCYNSGTVKAFSENEGYPVEVAGGISVGGIEITDCYNKGEIISEEEYALGIGCADLIRNCVNYGSVSGNSYILGIGKASVIDNCSNYGSVSGISYISGIGKASVIDNCSNYGTVCGIYEVGGICGKLSWDECSSISKCSNYGMVKGATNVGGIVGEANIPVSDCVNNGEVTYYNPNGYIDDDTYSARIGGVVGYSTSIISRCSNEHTIYQSNQSAVQPGHLSIGGIAGESTSVIFDCANRGDVICYDDVDNSITIGGIAGVGDIINQSCNLAEVKACGNMYYIVVGGISGVAKVISNSYNTGRVSKGAGICNNSKQIISCYNTGVVGDNNDGSYYVGYKSLYSYSLDTLTDEEMTQESSYDGFDFDNVWHIDINGDYPYPQLISMLKTAENSQIWDGTIATSFAGGNGSQENPYIISNAAELAYFVNSIEYSNTYYGKYISLINDITLNDYTKSAWITTATTWIPADYTFCGTFNGNNHTISGIYSEGCSLFNDNEGTICDLNIANSYFIDSAALLNSNSGIVKNCNMSGEIVFLGGGGMIYDSGFGDEDKILNCTNNAKIYAVGDTFGSIVSSNHGMLENCRNNGDITYIGGNDVDFFDAAYFGAVAGINRYVIKNCVNEGNIKIFGDGEYVGGIVGRNCADIYDCYNIGDMEIKGYWTVGGVVGMQDTCMVDEYGNSVYSMQNCYSFGEIIPNGNNAGFIAGYVPFDSVANCYFKDSGYDEYGTALNLSELTSKEAYIGFDFENTWGMSPNINNGYPYLLSHEYIPSYDITMVGKASLTFEDGLLKTEILEVAPENVSFIYEWYRNDELINEKGNILKPKKEDVGCEFYVKVKSKYCKGEMSTNLVEVKAFDLSGDIKIDGKPYINSILSVDTKELLPKGADFEYQWYSNGYPIYGATNSTYVVSIYDAGYEIGVKITATGIFNGEFESNTVLIENVEMGTIGNAIEWQINCDTETLMLSGKGGIEHTYDYYRHYIKRIEIEEGITELGSFCFNDFYLLESVIIPDSVTSIGENVFCPYCVEEMIIYGKPGSYAEMYAKENNIKFISIEDNQIIASTETLQTSNGIVIKVETNKDISGELVHAALYTKGKALIKWNEAIKIDGSHYEIPFDLSEDEIDEKDIIIRVFVWESTDTLLPLSEAIELNIYQEKANGHN